MMQVAAVQMRSTDQVQDNLDRCKSLIQQAADAGAKIIVVPENFAVLGPDEAGKRAVQESLDGPIISGFCELSKELKVNLILGGFPEKSSDPKRPYNSSVAINTDGKIIANYRKLHLFDVDLGAAGRISESAASQAGDQSVVCELGGHKVGLSICYDLRFSKLYSRLVDQGAEILTIPSAFTLQTGKDHWEVLVRARAIEFQSYVIAAAQWGQHNSKRHSFGNAMIVDPWGTVLTRCPEAESICIASVDMNYLHQVRTRLPNLQHRRTFD